MSCGQLYSFGNERLAVLGLSTGPEALWVVPFAGGCQLTFCACCLGSLPRPRADAPLLFLLSLARRAGCRFARVSSGSGAPRA
eukprot:8455849-Alexandrium_andersonii.AAC.1